MRTFRAALAEGRSALAEAGADTPALDARVLLAAATQLDMAALLARGEEPVPALADAAFASHLRSRRAGVPVSRILGVKEFWSLDFQVSAATLVPRPETEVLVRAVLDQVRACYPPDLTICDLGTGAGAILIALLSELCWARGVANDLSEAALADARANAERLGVAERISFHHGDFAHGPEGPFHVVVSNPPYVRADAIAQLPREVREHDPWLALDGGPDGLAAFRAIIGRAGNLLTTGGLLALEVGHDQSGEVVSLCRDGGLSDIEVHRDLAGVGRVVCARKS